MRFIQSSTATVAVTSAIVATVLSVFADRAVPAIARPPRFAVTEVTVSQDVDRAEATALNDKWQVVVGWFGAKGNGSVLWDRGKLSRSLGHLENGYFLQAQAINNAGQVVNAACYEGLKSLAVGRDRPPGGENPLADLSRPAGRSLPEARDFSPS